EVPDRGRLVRTILSEFTRIMDHCVCIGANLVDIGALSNFIYLYQNRENIYDLIESCCGARLTVSYVRVGGLAIDIPDDFVPRSRSLLESIPL
ncbi:NADH-quinone oxidoreductase subunit D, partial [Klebsiella pneumoniae]|nr:NADH-quinone oxidoreductase subunit D [Klebsiella pneumoniae]